MTLIYCAAVFMCFVGESSQQYTAYAATGLIDVYSPFTAAEPIFTSNANRFGYRMDQSQLSIHSQLDETYRVVALYWFLRRMPYGRAYGAIPSAPIRPPALTTTEEETPAPVKPEAETPPEKTPDAETPPEGKSEAETPSEEKPEGE